MNAKKAKEILSSVSETYSTIAHQFSASRKQMTKDLRGLLPHLPTQGLIADVGCGNGRLAGFLQQNLPPNPPKKPYIWEYLGIDQTPQFLEIAKNLHSPSPSDTPYIQFTQGNLLKLPLQNAETDAMIALRSLHHIPSRALQQQALAEIHRALKSGGTLILTVWDVWLPQRAVPLVKAIIRSILTLGAYSPKDTFIPWGKSVKRYYYAFTLKELKKLVTQAGFTITETPRIPEVNDLVIIAIKKDK